MNEAKDFELLDVLCADVERAWFENGDRDTLEQLVRQHPAFADELREFFEALLHVDTPNTDPRVLAAEERVWAWLAEGGLEAARRAATSPEIRTAPTDSDNDTPSAERWPGTPAAAAAGVEAGRPTDVWFMHVRTHASEKAATVAAAFPHATLEFLTLVSRFPHVVPPRVKATLAAAAEERFGVPSEDSLARLANAPAVRQAASRDRPFGQGVATFDDLLERAALTSEQQAFWRRCAEGLPS